MDIKIDDIVYPARCSRGYQKKYSMLVKYIKSQSKEIFLEGEKVKLSWMVASENGYSWYSFGSLTKNLTSKQTEINNEKIKS